MDKLEYLTEMMGSVEKAKAYLEKTSQMQKGLQDAGITSKEKEPAAETPATETPAPAAAAVTEAVVNLDMKAIVEQIGKEFDIEGLNVFVAQAQDNLQKIEVLEGLVKELQGSSDDKLAAALTPPAARYAWTRDNRPSQNENTKLKKDKADEDDKLSKAAPGVPDGYWLSEITGSVPVEAVK